MAIRPALRNILKVVGDLSKKDTNTNVVDTEVVQHSDGLSSAEVYEYLNEIESLGLIKMVKSINDKKEKDVETFRLLNITEKGLEELQSNQYDNQT
jgi:DNA-binding PadR family transcriptional regulator